MSLVAAKDSSWPLTSPLNKSVFWIALVASYVLSRLSAGIGIPIFIDEAIHIDWARPSAWTFLPLDPTFDGKWLSIKLFALATRLPLNSVIAGRLLVSILGLTAASACYLIGRDLFSRTAGAVSATLYVVLPFTVIYNSLALSDGVQFAFVAWAVFASVRVVRSDRWLVAAIALPVLLIAAILAKLSAIGLAALPIIALLLLLPLREWRRHVLRITPALVAALSLVGWLYARGMLGVFNTKAAENWDVKSVIWQNLSLTGEWFWGLLTPGIAILAIASFIWQLARRSNRSARFIAAVLCLNVLPYLLVARVWYPRYLLLAVIPIVLIIGAAVSDVIALLGTLKRSHPRLASVSLAVMIIGILSWPAARSGFVLFDLRDANLPQIEQYQLVSGWPSGYGLPELITFLQAQAQATPDGIIVARTVFSDHPLHSLNIYLAPSRSVSLLTLGDDNPSHVAEMALLSTRNRVLFVLSTENGVPERIREPAKPLLKCGQPIWSYTRPKSTSGFLVYEVRCSKDQFKALATPTN